MELRSEPVSSIGIGGETHSSIRGAHAKIGIATPRPPWRSHRIRSSHGVLSTFLIGELGFQPNVVFDVFVTLNFEVLNFGPVEHDGEGPGTYFHALTEHYFLRYTLERVNLGEHCSVVKNFDCLLETGLS